MRARLSTLCLGCMLLGPAHADTLLHSGFDDGITAPWRPVGAAPLAVTHFAGNASLRIGAGGAAQAAVSTRGFSAVVVSLSFAGWALGHGGRCSADVSADHGHHWTDIHVLRAGSDDGVTLHHGGRSVDDLADRDEIWIRLRTLSHEEAATCWADDIEITGERSSAPVAVGSPPGVEGGRGVEPVAGAARGPWSMGVFAVPPQAEAPRRAIEGQLSLGAIRSGAIQVLRDPFGLAGAERATLETLPSVTLDLVSDGTALLPVQRGTIRGPHRAWDWVSEPGHVWRDPARSTLTRVVLPFSLEEHNANCLHNGMLAFALDETGTTSDVAIQISSETCAYFQFDEWRVLNASFQPADLAVAGSVRAARRRELAARLPVRPIQQLARDHPGTDPAHFGSSQDVSREALSAFGVVVDGIHYVGDCPTRSGSHPDCDELALPSYSLAKSLVAGLALMRLERLYPGTAALAVADLITECKTAAWQGVTLRNLLDMSSGHFGSAVNQADEDGPDLLPFFDAEDHASRMAFACNHYPRREGPGLRWIYHTSDTYLLGAALAEAYRRHAGANADFYRDLLVRDLFVPLALNPALAETRRTNDLAQQPFTGYGLTLHRDDVARLALYLQRASDGHDDGLLDVSLLREALQRDPARRGLPAPGPDLRYQHGFWAWNAASTLGCASDAWVPFMSGYGGIIVAMFPNGIVYYYFSDGGEFRWADAAREANHLRPFCEVVKP